MQRFALKTAAVALALCLPLSAQAHRSWLLPAATVLSGDEPWVTVDAAVSNDIFHADHAPMRLDALQVIAPDGKQAKAENTSTGKHRSTFDVALTQPGTYKLAVASSGLQARWEDENGKRKMWPPRGERYTQEGFAKAVPAMANKLEVTQSSRRVETFVTAGSPTEGVLKPTNVGLELVPVTHPNDLFSGEKARFTLLIDGKPAVGAKVEIIPGGMRYRNGQNEISLTSDAKGAIEVTWPAPGMYWLSASYEDKQATPPATQRRGGYTATLEVLPE